MRSSIAKPIQALSYALLLSWTTLACAQDEIPAAPPKDDPLVVKPTTIEGKFAAALFMLKIARPDLARYYLEQTLADNPTDADMLELRKIHGTGVFLQLTAKDELNPPATELLNRMNLAIQAAVAEPGYADALLDKLSGSPRDRVEALAELRHLGPYAVPPIIKRLAGNAHDDSEILAVTLARLGANAAAPLIGALTSPDPEVRAIAARVLGQVGATQDAIWLWGPAFIPDEPAGSQLAAREALARLKYGDEKAVGKITGEGAARNLLTVATQHLNGTYKWPERYDDVEQIPVWTWDETEQTVVEHVVSRTQASIFDAERLAREATQLSPELQQGPVVLLASLLCRAVEQNEWETPLPNTSGGPIDLAIACGPDLCEQVLRFSLDQKVPAAALGSLQALASNGSVDYLSTASPHGAVIAALDAPESRVQFAAAVTILHWEPTVSFRGSRRVVEILARALNSDQAAASVVMDPNEVRANETASLFTELGFTATPTSSGKAGFQIASNQGNIELAVVHPNVLHWELSETLANLRADSRTASIPVIIYGPASLHGKYETVSHEYRNVAYLDEGNVPVDISKNLRPLLAQLSPPLMSSEQRGRQMAEASFWLRRIAIRNVSKVFDLTPAQEALAKAITKPELAEDALVSLGAIGTSLSQKTLFMTATAPALPLEVRTLAASQLAFHIQHFGALLTPDESGTLKSAYENETDANLRTAFASVIGSLKPAAPAVRLELLRYPASPAPVGSSAQQ
ncbi:HEAT repeat domain-containing protein [Planctomicrobium sp. SH661]|uniref:HEAT repeat domain-containing protein n=1 Tax=Planctomicrobium sp. SH661 TaxID=3448124 RepID=UPI003F5B2855